MLGFIVSQNPVSELGQLDIIFVTNIVRLK